MAYKLSKLYITAAGPHYETVCERSEFREAWDYAIEMFQAYELNIVGCHYDPGPDHTEAPQSAEFFVAAPGVHETYVIQAN